MACGAPRLHPPGQQSLLCRQPIALYLGMLLACQATAQIIQTVEVVQDTLPSFSTEVTDPKYIVAVDTHGPAAEDGSASNSATKLSMRDSSGRLFTCLLPENVTGSDDAQDGLVSREGGKESAQTTPGELLGALDTLCMYRIEDWWTYELCYKRSVRQFHKEGSKVVSEYDLGTYSEELSSVDEVQVDESAEMGGAGAKYVMQMYDGGQPCDITGQARATEVRFVCAPDAKDAILSIREAATCRYTLVFATPRLCALPAFATPEPAVHRILCGLAEGTRRPAEGETTQGAGAAGGGGDAAGVPAAGAGVVVVQQGSDAGSEGREVLGEEVRGLEEEGGGEEGPGSGEERGQGESGLRPEDAGELQQNTSARGEGLGNAHAQSPEGDVQGGERGGAPAEDDGEEERPASRTDMASGVGPPMPPAHAALEDPGDGQEDDEVEFIRTGMYAEL